MMSGLLPSKVGGYDNAPEFSSAIPTFAHYLRLAGYRTCLSGKMHFAGPDQLHGYEERLTTDIYPSDFGWTPNWSEPDAKVTFQDMQNVIETGPCLRSLQIDYDDDVNTQAVRRLYGRDGGDDGAAGIIALADGTALRSKGRQLVGADQRLRLSLPGGGGFGVPNTRDTTDIEADIEAGLITLEQAFTAYGYRRAAR